VSADTIAPGKNNPQNRNRYSYTLNNPLRWVDPSGHCVEDYERTEAGCRQYLKDHAWEEVLGDWLYDELALFVASIQDLKRAMGWVRADYVAAMTGGGTYKLRATMSDQSAADPNRTGQTVSETGGFLTINIFRKNAFFNYDGSRKDITTIKGTFVHEQAHIWDFASGGEMSRQLARSLAGHVERDAQTGVTKYVTTDKPPTDAGVNPVEDWAETVMAMTYADHYRVTRAVSEARQQAVRTAASEGSSP
jgi:hypothetical protein